MRAGYKKKSLGRLFLPENIHDIAPLVNQWEPWDILPVSSRSKALKGSISLAPSSPDGFSRPIEACVNKIVPFRFSGTDMSFRLSHGLFSSYDIDEGTRLLLKSIAQRLDLAGVDTLLDVGCGVGVIGVSICRRAPHIQGLLQDRDALAAAFARENADVNAAAGIAVDCGLAFWHVHGRLFDLIACNIPAKAGEPVLRSFFEDIGRFLSPRGTAAVVIVSPLAAFALQAVDRCGYEVKHSEQTRDYLVLHFRARADRLSPPPPSGEPLQPYVRAHRTFSHADISYELDTAWSLPDFDTLGYALQATMDLVTEGKISGELLFWNPGQGHLPVSILAARGSAVSGIRLAARDFLQLAIADRNMRAAGRTASSLSAIPFESGLRETAPRGSIDWLFAVPQPIPRAPWQAQMAQSAAALLRPGGMLLLACTSTEVHRFLAGLRGFQVMRNRKLFGYRAVMLKKLQGAQ